LYLGTLKVGTTYYLGTMGPPFLGKELPGENFLKLIIIGNRRNIYSLPTFPQKASSLRVYIKVVHLGGHGGNVGAWKGTLGH